MVARSFLQWHAEANIKCMCRKSIINTTETELRSLKCTQENNETMENNGVTSKTAQSRFITRNLARKT